MIKTNYGYIISITMVGFLFPILLKKLFYFAGVKGLNL